jgi:hypothetical protein
MSAAVHCTTHARGAQRSPEPNPPSAEEAARILAAAWDDDWGTFVWLRLVTGMRRAEQLPDDQDAPHAPDLALTVIFTRCGLLRY